MYFPTHRIILTDMLICQAVGAFLSVTLLALLVKSNILNKMNQKESIFRCWQAEKSEPLPQFKKGSQNSLK